MKRIFHPLATFILAFALLAGFSSCRSHKDMARGKHQSQPNAGKESHESPEKDTNDKMGMKTRRKIVEEALRWRGTPYGYARAEKGVATDCSGMVVTVYQEITGIKLPRNSAQQCEFCKRINRKDVKIGDLVFFATGKDPDRVSHVGIMIDKDNFVHASASKGVVVSDANSPYYQRTFKGFGTLPD